MSVEIIEMTEINTYRNQFINSLNLYNKVIETSFYKHASKHYIFDYKPKTDKKEAFRTMIDYMLWYCHVANVTAYNLQYKENVKFEFETEFDDKMKACKDNGENHIFSSLLYNIASNSGTIMMQNDFKELAYFVSDAIKERVFRNDKPLNEPTPKPVKNSWGAGSSRHPRKGDTKRQISPVQVAPAQVVKTETNPVKQIVEVAEKVLKTDEYDKNIANTILSQLGGFNRLHSMIGLKNIVVVKNGVMFGIKCRGAKANHIKITLNGSDLYDIEFKKVWGESIKNIDTKNDVYCDQLIELIENTTGLLLNM